jgi:hypothetical protein
MKLFILLMFMAFNIEAQDLKFSQNVFETHEMTTFAGTSGKQYSICWKISVCIDCVSPKNIQFRKYRVEGGQQYFGQILPSTSWTLKQEFPNGEKEYCIRDSIAMSGHWVYEAKMCGDDVSGNSLCRTIKSINPTESYVGIITDRPWWIYTFLGSPGVPEI